MLIRFTAVAAERPKIALIIDDMGAQQALGLAALQLPGAVTYSFLPFAPYTQQLASLAYQQNKELMLHMPMQAIEPEKWEAGELKLSMTQAELADLVQRQLQEIPYIAGVNNHKGSLVTQDYASMRDIMQLLVAARGHSLYFVDSLTTSQSIAQQVALEFGLASRARDVFLDHNAPDTAIVRQQFRQLIILARRYGSALGIAHPRPNTLKVLRDELPNMAALGVQLVPVSALCFQYPQGRVFNRQEVAAKIKARFQAETEIIGEYDIF